MIIATDLSKTYFKGAPNEVVAVDGVNLTIKDGDFITITGPSGSGKSTLMNLLGLLTYPSKGKILYNEMPVTLYSDAKRTTVRRDMVGFIFQQYNLLLHLSAWENVGLPLVCRGVETSERKKIAVEMLGRLGIGNRVGFKVAHLSGGEQQRVAIARALVTEPKIVFADEPTASVDDENARLIIRLFKEMKEANKTVVVSTHDQIFGNEANRRLKMVAGKLTET